MASEELTTFFDENPAVAKSVIDKVVAASRAPGSGSASSRTYPPQNALEVSSLPGNWLIVLSAIPCIRNYSWWKGIQPAARPNWGGIDHSRLFCRSGVKS